MKLAVSNLAWEISQDSAVLKLLQTLGITGVELAPTKIWTDPTRVSDRELEAYARRWREQGITPIATQSLLFGHPELTLFQDSQTRLKTLQYLKAMIRVSATLGVKVMVFGSPKNRLSLGQNQVELFEIAGSFFRELGEIAQQHQLSFCVEPNAPAYGCDFITTTQEGVELIEYIGHPAIRLHLDTGILSLNQESATQAIQLATPYLAHLHVSEPFLKPIGSGPVDHQTVAAAVRASHYPHWVSVEMITPGNPPDLEIVEKSLRFTQAQYA